MARVLARLFAGEGRGREAQSRLSSSQFTPDLMPSDMAPTSITASPPPSAPGPVHLRQRGHGGRNQPRRRGQSALLEGMERQVTEEGSACSPSVSWWCHPESSRVRGHHPLPKRSWIDFYRLLIAYGSAEDGSACDCTTRASTPAIASPASAATDRQASWIGVRNAGRRRLVLRRRRHEQAARPPEVQ